MFFLLFSYSEANYKMHSQYRENGNNMEIRAYQTNLSRADLKMISDGEWLSDTVIHTVQSMIKCQFPLINGLQDPVLGQESLFSIYRDVPFVQVLHTGKMHWQTISTYGCEIGEIFLFDSRVDSILTESTKKQICSILHCENKAITVKRLPVQQQKDSNDCGLFALAFIFYIAKNLENPISVTFNQPLLRTHLLHCLKNGKMTDFPTQSIKAKTCKEKDYVVGVSMLQKK